MCDARNECILSDTGKEKEQHGNKTKTKQNKTKQDKTRQDKTKQNKTRQILNSLTHSLTFYSVALGRSIQSYRRI
jgi:hypothetical protein